MSDNEEIEKQGVIDQLIAENERLRERLTDNARTNPVSEAIDTAVIVFKQSEPLKVYMWVASACMIAMVLLHMYEVFKE